MSELQLNSSPSTNLTTSVHWNRQSLSVLFVCVCVRAFLASAYVTNSNYNAHFSCIIQLQESVGEQLTKNNLVMAFASLLKAEVRAAASNRLRGKEY